MILEDLELPEMSSLATHMMARNNSPAFDLVDIQKQPIALDSVKLSHVSDIVIRSANKVRSYIDHVKVGTRAEYHHHFESASRSAFEELRKHEDYGKAISNQLALSDANEFKVRYTVEVVDDLVMTYTHEVIRSQQLPDVYLLVHVMVIDHLRDKDDNTAWRHCVDVDLIHHDTLDQADVDKIMARSKNKEVGELVWIMDTYIREEQWS